MTASLEHPVISNNHFQHQSPDTVVANARRGRCTSPAGLNKKLTYRKPIARQLHTKYVDGVTLKSRLGVNEGRWKWHHSIDNMRLI